MKISAIIALAMALFTEAMADGHCKGFLSDDTCYFAITDTPLNLAGAEAACEKEGAELAVIKTDAVYNLAEAYVKDNYEYPRGPYAVFWVAQVFDHMSGKVQFPDGDSMDKDELANMWYKGQPSTCARISTMVLVFRSAEALIKDPSLEEHQGLYTIKANSNWMAMCMTSHEE